MDYAAASICTEIEGQLSTWHQVSHLAPGLALCSIRRVAEHGTDSASLEIERGQTRYSRSRPRMRDGASYD